MKRRMSKEKQATQFIMIAVCITALLFGSLLPTSLGNPFEINQELTVSYMFSQPTITSLTIDSVTYDQVLLTDGAAAGKAGEPCIPSKGAYVLLPPQTKMTAIHVDVSDPIVLGDGYFIEPQAVSQPIDSSAVPLPRFTDSSIYGSDSYYPESLYQFVGTYDFRGYEILVMLLHPIHYQPITGELFYYPSMQLTIATSPDPTANSLYRGFTQDYSEAASKVDNPHIAAQYREQLSALPTSFDSYDLMILTTDSLKNDFEALKQAHDATGVSTVIKTLTDVGSTDLNAIRSYIRDSYATLGVEYVLIGGDDTVVPAPILWVLGMDENTTPYTEYMPSDLFYACLDGPYNFDGDNRWGEPTDGEGGGDVDLIADVFVGRACVDNLADVNDFVTKTVAYINKDPEDEYLKKICFLGEHMGDYGIATWSGTYMDQLIDVCSDDGYTTIGYPSSEYVITKLYDSPGYTWHPSDLMAVINNDVHMINHLGHSYYDYNMKLDSSDVYSLTNDKYCFIYSQGCMAGGFDDYDCFAEYYTVKTDTAAVAGVWNARYGFFWSYSTDGDSQRLHRQFWDAVFAENMVEIGRVNHDSKEDNLFIIGRSCIRWCYYQTNLFGDPALSFVPSQSANYPPNRPLAPEGPDLGEVIVEYSYTTSSHDIDGDQIWYWFDWGDETNSGWLGPYASYENVSASHSWNVAGEYVVTVKAKDAFDAESTWSDPLMVTLLEFDPVFLVGFIQNKNTMTAYTSFDVRLVLMLPGSPVIQTSGSFVVADDYQGIFSEQFIFGRYRITTTE